MNFLSGRDYEIGERHDENMANTSQELYRKPFTHPSPPFKVDFKTDYMLTARPLKVD